MFSTKLIPLIRHGKFMTHLNLATDAMTINGTKNKMMMSTSISRPLINAKKASTAKSVKAPTTLKVKPSKPLQGESKVKRPKSPKKTSRPDWSVETLVPYLHSLSMPVLGGMAFLVAFSPEEMPSSLMAKSHHPSPDHV